MHRNLNLSYTGTCSYVCNGPAEIFEEKLADLHPKQGNFLHRNYFSGVYEVSHRYTK
jgi:hypothetical protein